jgi:hypothetical protein
MSMAFDQIYNSSQRISHPDICENMYTIDQRGNVYNLLEEAYISWNYKKYPYVNLVNKNRDGLVSVYIKDLMAFSYLANTEDYLERGQKIVNIDGDYSNCNIHNIILIDSNEENTKNSN